MNNCYVCGANLGIYSRGVTLDKGEKYVFCSRCYWGVMPFHKPLHKLSSLEELDKLEEKLDKKISTGKLKDRQAEALKVCYEEKRKELKIQTQILEQYEKTHNPSYKTETEQTSIKTGEGSEKIEQTELSKITTADKLAGVTIEEYLGPVSVQQTIETEIVEKEAEFSKIKQELALKLLLEAQNSGGEGVIGLKYSLTSLGAGKMLLMADGTSVK